MKRTILPFERSKKRLSELVRYIIDDIATVDACLDNIFDDCSPEQLDELRRRLEFVQAEVEALKAFPQTQPPAGEPEP